MTEVLEPDRLDLTMGGADETVTGLRDYVVLVAAALGVGLESCDRPVPARLRLHRAGRPTGPLSAP
ncbi:MAG TPA: hypothetical protein VGG05_16720 [Pseudonocardiaceae bacterium]